MASRDLTLLDPKLLPLADAFFQECQQFLPDFNVFCDCTYRSKEEQDVLFAQGRTTPGDIVTHARGGESAHNYTNAEGLPSARAFDIAIETTAKKLDWKDGDEIWSQVHTIARSLGLALGEDWPEPLRDPPHMELENWQSA